MEDRQQLKRQRFVRVAQRRTQRVLKALQVLANCSNKSAYLYTDEDVAKIFDALQSELERTRLRFGERREEFRLE